MWNCSAGQVFALALEELVTVLVSRAMMVSTFFKFDDLFDELVQGLEASAEKLTG